MKTSPMMLMSRIARPRLASSLLLARQQPLCRAPLLSPIPTLTRLRALSSHAHERRLDLDKQPLTRTEFARKYGGTKEWDAAAGRSYVQLRCAPDGKPYTAREFEDYFGGSVSDRDGVAYQFWDGARHAAHKLTNTLNEHRRIEDILDTHGSFKCGMDLSLIHI